MQQTQILTRLREADVCTILHICTILVFPWGKILNSMRNLETYLTCEKSGKTFQIREPHSWSVTLGNYVIWSAMFEHFINSSTSSLQERVCNCALLKTIP